MHQQPVRYMSKNPIAIHTYHRQVFEWTSFLNVLQGFFQISQLAVHDTLGLLGALHGLRLEGLNGLDLSAHIIGLWLECLELFFDLIDHGGVLQHGAVVGEVDGRRLFTQNGDLAAGVVISLLEGSEGTGG